MMNEKVISISVVIPTYNRGSVLLDTIRMLLEQVDRAEQILIIDQTDYPNADPTASSLQRLQSENDIVWIKLTRPSIPAAMNKGLELATSEFVLFLDDDISIQENFIRNYKFALNDSRYSGYVGQIIQPWQSVVELQDYSAGQGINSDMAFPFNSNAEREINNCMAGNLCLKRQRALDIGGFDEQFSQVAYRFETEFCRRLITATAKPFKFVPSASINHLKANTGGTRAHAQNHLTSCSSSHSVGDYYFAIQHFRVTGSGAQAVVYILKRLSRSCWAKFYLRRPWWIPVRIIAELKGLFRAVGKALKGPIYMR